MKLKQIFRAHFDLILGFLFFVSYRYYFTWILWRGRGVPPEPDDSYFYLSSAARVFSPQNFEDFRLLSFSLYLKLISFLTQTGLEVAYQINFYIGPVLIFACLAYFLYKLEVSKKIRLLLFIMLTLYSGSGSYHGFYWVVPSFYQLALFFVMLTLVIDQKPIMIKNALPVSLAFIFIHPTSIFVSFIFIIYPFVLSFVRKKLSIINLKNTAVICAALIISYLIYFLLGLNFPHADSPESFQTSVNLVFDFFSGKLKPSSFPVIWHEYFSILFVNTITTAAYFAMFFFVYRIKQYKILAIYVSTLLLVLVSSFLPYGWRTLGFLWPITFILVGYSFVGLYTTLKTYSPALKSLALLAIVVLIFLTTSFNLILIKSLNARNNYNWDRSCVSEIIDKNVFFYSHESMNAFTLHGLNPNRALLMTQDKWEKILKEGSYVINIETLKNKRESLSSLENLLTSKITRRYLTVNPPLASNAWTTRVVLPDEVDNALATKGLEGRIVKNCGHFRIYKINLK